MQVWLTTTGLWQRGTEELLECLCISYLPRLLPIFLLSVSAYLTYLDNKAFKEPQIRNTVPAGSGMSACRKIAKGSLLHTGALSLCKCPCQEWIAV
ncbi:hypothetical protein Y1Q_0022813 [Alligator mississippiensis]|uniref:Uncharacterized protein n=1 Tax=Alligator mississippiensis TaxID=8496 RepID=A0A151N4L3_ALLMI|nr:hypothetical protein Y1Q_0022813 [Alligator mississippiensis]